MGSVVHMFYQLKASSNGSSLEGFLRYQKEFKKKKKKIGQKNQLSKININKSKISSNFKGQLEIILSYFLKVCLHAN